MCFPAEVSDANYERMSSCLFCARDSNRGGGGTLPPACWDEALGSPHVRAWKAGALCDKVKSSLLPKIPIHPAKLNVLSVFQSLLRCSCCRDGNSAGCYTRWPWGRDQGRSAGAAMGLCFAADFLFNFFSFGLRGILFSWLSSFWKAAGVFSVSNSWG